MKKRGKPDLDRIIVGRHPVREILERGDIPVEKVFIQKKTSGRPVQDIRYLATQANIPVIYVPESRLHREAPGLNHQGVLAFKAPFAYFSLDNMLAQIAPTLDLVNKRKPTLLLLDRIQDPYNFGAILRSAVAAGAAGVIVPAYDMAPLNAEALKASAGTAERIPIAREKSIPEVVFRLKERGFWIVGATETGGTSIWEMDWNRPVVLVIGNEGKGMSRHLSESCDFLVSIPMVGPTESLNASVAAGIFLFVANRLKDDRVE